MQFPNFLKRHSVTVEAFLGSGAYGPEYGPVVTVKCFRDDQSKLVKTAGGDEVMSVASLYCSLSENVPIGSRVTLAEGTIYTVIDSRRRDGGGLPTFDHLEVIL